MVQALMAQHLMEPRAPACIRTYAAHRSTTHSSTSAFLHNHSLCTLTDTHTHRHTLSVFLPHAHTYSLSFSLTLSHTHTHTHTHTPPPAVLPAFSVRG